MTTLSVSASSPHRRNHTNGRSFGSWYCQSLLSRFTLLLLLASTSMLYFHHSMLLSLIPEASSIIIASPSSLPVVVEKVWDWHYYANDDATRAKSPRVLISQYSGLGKKYMDMLHATAGVNKAYASLHGYDYVSLGGVGIAGQPPDYAPKFQERHSSFNKIELLLRALKHVPPYDLLLILDADCLIYNFTMDVESLLPAADSPTTMVVAHRVNKEDPVRTWHINNGITLWNLHHPSTSEITHYWKEKALVWLHEEIDNGDQEILHRVLQQRNASEFVRTLTAEFSYRQATFIRHYNRIHLSWTNVSADERMLEVRRTAKEVCGRHKPACEGFWE